MPGARDAWAEVSNDAARVVVTSAIRADFERNHDFNTISPELAGIMAALSTSGDNPASILADYTGPTGSISDQDLARSYPIAIARNRSNFYDLYDRWGRNFDAARQAASEIHEQELAESERANDTNQDGETWQDLAGPRNGNDCLAVFDRAAQIPVSQTIKFHLDHEFLAIVIPNRVNGFQSNTPMHLRPQNGALWRPRLPHNSDCTPWF